MTENNLKKLLSEMSLTEKIGELSQMPGEYYNTNVMATGENATLEFPQEIVDTAGSVLNVRDTELIIKVQKKHMERHPHHIPMLFMLDIIHGYHTTFPVPIAQGCSFDPEIVEKIASATAKEACVSGMHVTFSPMVDLVRDARWGRVTESSGEDPYLNSVMAEAVVKGYQGDDLSKEGTICACVKHFAAYGGVEGGREYGSVDVSERTLRQYYLPPYKAACDAGSGMLMTAFNTIGGVPATGDKHLVKDILRDEWGYDGTVITDYGSMNNMQSHRISDSDEELARSGAKSTIMHGFGKEKLAAVKAIKPVIENGEVISHVKNYNNTGVDRYIVAAKGLINNSEAVVGVVIKSYPKNNSNSKFYLHEAEIIKTGLPVMTAPQLSVYTVSKSVSDATVPQKAQSVNTIISIPVYPKIPKMIQKTLHLLKIVFPNKANNPQTVRR